MATKKKKTATKKAPAKKTPAKKTAKKATAKKPATRPAKKPASTSKAGSVVPEFLKGVPAAQQAVVNAVEAVVLSEVPGATSVIKWGHPVWEKDGKPFALCKALKDYVLLGFWDSKNLVVPGVKLEGNALKQLQFTDAAAVDNASTRKALQVALKQNVG